MKQKCQDNRLSTWGGIIFSLLASVIIVLSHKFVADGTLFVIDGSNDTYSTCLSYIYQVVFLGFLLFLVYCFFEHLIIKHAFADFKQISIPWFHYDRIKRGLINALILFCLLLPAFLALYPGYQSYDAPLAAGAFLQDGHLDALQPVLHTVFTASCYALGNFVTGSYQAGVLIYALIQELVVIAIYVIVIDKLIELKVPDLVIGISTALLFINPVVQTFVFATDKDTLYGAFALLWVVYLVDGYRKCDMDVIPLSISALMMCQMRKQGIYILIITFLICLVTCFRRLKSDRYPHFVASFLIPIVCTMIISGPIYSVLGIAGDNPAEKLSVPIQQIARVVATEKETVASEDLEIIYKYLPQESFATYIPEISDPVKSCFNNDLYSENKADFWLVWWKLFDSHKKTYVDAWLYLVVGYFYPDASGTNDWGYVAPFVTFLGEEFHQEPILHGYNQYLMSASSSMFNGAPLLSNLICISMPFWVIAYLACQGLTKRKKVTLICLIPPLLYFATLLIGPVCCIRYVLPLYMLLPTCIASCFIDDKHHEKTYPKVRENANSNSNPNSNSNQKLKLNPKLNQKPEPEPN
jgi:hypothetical protein